jgi:hypothetical protein
MRSSLLVISIALVVAASARGSEEEFLPWREVRIAMDGNDQTGKLLFTAKTRAFIFQEIRVEAFGKEHAIAKEMLDKLTDFPLDSLVTTHEAGFERLGGHMVHFKFKKVHFDKNRGAIETRIVLSITKNKGPVISEPSEKVLKAAAPAVGHFARVEIRGVLHVAADQSGEIILALVTLNPQGPGTKVFNLEFPEDPALRKLARSLHGQTVVLSGESRPPELDLISGDHVPLRVISGSRDIRSGGIVIRRQLIAGEGSVIIVRSLEAAHAK